MKSIRREQNQESTRREIKTYAWHQIATNGVDSISLGAIARSMNLTTPALYRYFVKRNDLIQALTLDAYYSFYSSLNASVDTCSTEDQVCRFRTLGQTYYQWAVDHTPQYQIIFGIHSASRIQNDQVADIADRCLLLLLDVLDKACQAGQLKPQVDIVLSKGMQARLERFVCQDHYFSANVVYLALVTWSFLNGVTSLELSQKYSLILARQTQEFFNLELERFMKSIGFG